MNGTYAYGGWVTVVALVAFTLAVLCAGWYVGQQLVDGVRAALP